jgi:bifunctional non-homologous end joining protein LigD
MRSKLDVYNAKRDFSQTPEPSGKTPTKRAAKKTGSNTDEQATQLRFVIQKHAASRLHYDFRLELDGVMKSWAVTRGPSIDPADKRLAVEVEDHPLDYGDFEGTIPAGQYGGGTVQLWDRGYWKPQGPKSPQASLKAGELKFELFGERLSGSWVLVRMRNASDEKHVNWLLIKHRDAAESASPSAAQAKREQRAAAALLDTDASIASGRSMKQIAAGQGAAPKPFITAVSDKPARKAVRANASLAEKQQPVTRSKAVTVKHLPTFIEPALCKLMTEPPESDEWLHEVKLDGYRLQLRVANGKVTLRTRKGLDWTDRFSSVAQAARSLPPCIIDGEVVALDAQGNPSFAALQAALGEDDSSKLVFFAFDLLFAQQHDLRKQPLTERKAQLQTLLSTLDSDTQLRYVEHVVGNGSDVLKSACRMKLEGVISKRADSIYASERTGSWIKTKCRAGHEVVIGGMTTDGGELRSLLVGVMRARKLVYVGRVGTGFGANTRKLVMPKLKAAVSDANPFQGATAPRKERNVTWLKPTLVAEIEFAGWTGGGMVRQAAFKGLRQDKPANEVRAETPAVKTRMKAASKLTDERSTATRKTKQPKRSAPEVNDAQPHITHPEKILWPAIKQGHAFTKLDLAEYYQRVSEWLLPHVQGRPCSIVRAPDGIEGEQFFQRHAMLGASHHVKTIKIDGDRKPYLMIDSVEALAAVAQLGALELHPGNCVPGDPEVPGRLVFDLDPAPEVEFKAVIKAALELRERLQQVGMTAFCKTTGGKGLHVVVPLANKSQAKKEIDWRTAKVFTQTLCAQMAQDSPEQYLIKMSKAQRSGRIFLDYLRNDRVATAVAPLSPRARPGATVSMPLQWQQVRTGLDPSRFTIATVTSLLDKSQPWQDYADTGNSLPGAMKLLLAQ